MKNKNILVFGASGGIGKCICQSLEESGVNVLKVDRSSLNLEDLENLGKNFTNVLDLNNVQTVDGVVYTSGVILDSKVESNPSDTDLQKVFAVNTFAPILIHNLLQDKISANACFIYLSSTATLGPNGLYPLYTTSKSATETFLKLQADKIKRGENKFQKIITIIPGPTNTAMRERIAGDAQSKQDPLVIANAVRQIVLDNKYESGDFVIVKDGKIEIKK